MKRTAFSLLFAVAAGLVAIAPPVFAQDAVPLSKPLHGYYTYGKNTSVMAEQALSGAAAETTIPMGLYTVTSSRDENVYTGAIVGRSPFFHGARTTNIPTYIIPLKVKTSDGQVFDPSVKDSTCFGGDEALTIFQNSPLFQSAPFTMNGVNVGTTQYSDAFLRGEFWSLVSVTGNRFHTMLSPVTTLAEQTLSLSSSQGGDFTGSFCGHIAIMDYSTFDSYYQSLITSLSSKGVGPTTFPFVLLYNVVMAAPYVPGTSEYCCILGYHNSVGSPAQAYGVGDLDSTGAFSGTSDISALSHEVNEFVNDPSGNNLTPLWGHVGQVSGCQGNFEVGDPLSGTLFPAITLNSFTYHVQELAFFSWFYGEPSIGTGIDDFSDNDTFTTDAGAPCT